MKIFSVNDVTKYIKQQFDYNQQLSFVYIRGEISNFKRHYSGHCYFTLKDSQAMIKAVMFKSRAQFLKFQPQDGLKVIAAGKITVFERDGQYQLYAEELIPDGVGELSLAFEQLKNKLSAEGLFADDRKQALPLLPQKVGIVTSPTGAAIRDIITVAKRRHPGVQLVLFPVQVQGRNAAEEIEKALQILNELAQVEVIIVGRGGGSIEELWAFNEERVVRAIANSKVPIVSAVGHETDYTLADFAADVRAATPSQAAELVAPDIKELNRYITTLQNVMVNHIHAIIANKKMRLNQSMQHRVFSHPKEFLSMRQLLLDKHMAQLQQVLDAKVQSKKYQFTILAEKLSLLNPLAVLSRGFSIVRNREGKSICNSQDAAVGEMLEIVLSKGMLEVQVIKMRSDNDGKTKTNRNNQF